MADEHDRADLFARQVDRLLDDEPEGSEQSDLVDLAEQLTALDWSAESEIRAPLRRRLLAGEARRSGPGWWVTRRPIRWRRWWPLPLLALLATLLLALPGGLTAASNSLETLVQRVVYQRPLLPRVVAVAESEVPGTDFTVHQVGPDQVMVVRDALSPMIYFGQSGEIWVVRTSIGTFGGSALPGQRTSVEYYGSLDRLESAVRHKLWQPGYLPTGYGFREGVLAPSDAAYIFYGDPTDEIVLVQLQVQQPSHALSDDPLPSFAALLDRPVETVTVDGRVAGWIEGRGLVWETDETSLLLGGNELTREEALRIAASLRR